MACFLASAMTLPFAGCGSGKSLPPQYPVRGKVVSKGQPAAEAIVTLHAASPGASKVAPRGVTATDGTFVIGSRLKDDGAPEGEYAVTIVWPQAQDPQKQFENTPPDRLEGRYNDAKNPKWRVHIAAGKNDLGPFEVE
jgi:hypothetical protein